MSNLTHTKTGFFWGLGFILSTLIVISLFSVFAAKKLENFSDYYYEKDRKDHMNIVRKMFDVKVIEIFKSENLIRVTISVARKDKEPFYSMSVRVMIFDKDDIFLSECFDPSNDKMISAGEIDYLEAVCKMSDEQIARAKYAVADVSL